MKLTALIPVYNDDYALRFCLASIVRHFEEIIVLDDASTDDTPDVALEFVSQHTNVRYHRHEGPQLGWVQARTRLLELAGDARHLFWIDSDDVLCEYNAHLLREIAEGRHGGPIVRLQLCEMWGDFQHTTRRLRHYDRCHLYTDRARAGEFRWAGGAMARLVRSATPNKALYGKRSPGPLFFHIKGVKPDRRLVERQRIRAFLRRPGTADSLAEFARLEDLTDEDIHHLALHMLLRSRQDRLTPTYRPQAPSEAEKGGGGRKVAAAGDIAPRRAPRRPEAIVAALPSRFQIIYEDGHPVDRIDQDREPAEKAQIAAAPKELKSLPRPRKRRLKGG